MILLLYIFVGLIAFGQLPYSFFQQDEWAIFGNFLYWQKAGLSWIDRLFFYGGVTHLIPFANIFSYIQFKLFGLSFAPYALTSIFLHVINALLIVKLVLQLKSSKTLAVLSGLFFLVNPTTHQAVTWIATTPGTVISVTFTLVTLIFFLQGRLFFSLIGLIVALGFKESSVFLFLYIPVLYVFFLINEKKSFRYIGSIIFLGLLYVALRLFFRIVGPQIPIASSSFLQPPPVVYIYRLVTHPLKVLSQSIIPQEIIVQVAHTMVKLGYPQFILSDGFPNPFILESVGVDIISYALSFIILGVLFFARKFSLLFFSILLIIISTFPLIVIPGKAGYISLFDGRHLYMTSVGTSILLAVLVLRSIKRMPLLRWGTVGFTAAYLTYGMFYIRETIHSQVMIAETRKNILEKITTWYPTLPKKVIIITKSDKAFYGLSKETHIFPFQSGFGNTLLVWYDMRGENFPACFFEKKFLYELISQDYKECGGRGFGYFRYPTDIGDIIHSYSLASDAIFSFSYTYRDNSIVDVTKDIRLQLISQ